MNSNLETQLAEMQNYLESNGFVIFHSDMRSPELPHGGIYWNAEKHPDFRDFAAAAQAVGVRMMTLFSRIFDAEAIDLVLEGLDFEGLDRGERRTMEQKLDQLRDCDGFVCRIELSFDHAERTYIYDVRTDWLDDFEELAEDMGTPFDDDDVGEPGPF
jgi:hypothetical protein